MAPGRSESNRLAFPATRARLMGRHPANSLIWRQAGRCCRCARQAMPLRGSMRTPDSACALPDQARMPGASDARQRARLVRRHAVRRSRARRAPCSPPPPPGSATSTPCSPGAWHDETLDCNAPVAIRRGFAKPYPTLSRLHAHNTQAPVRLGRAPCLPCAKVRRQQLRCTGIIQVLWPHDVRLHSISFQGPGRYAGGTSESIAR